MLIKVVYRVFLGYFCLCLISTSALAGVEQIVADLKPLSAVVVMEMQGEYLIDKDASHGVRAGDIFAAVTAGEKIIHPVTKEVLGTLEQVRAQLRISKVKTGYSYALPLPGSSQLKPGEAIVRFQGLPATFWDYTGTGETLFAELKAGLPALEWADYASAQAMKPEQPRKVADLEGMVFVLTGNGLEIRDASFQSIRFYSRADMVKEGIALAKSAPAVAAPVVIQTPVPHQQAGIVKPDATAAKTAAIVPAETRTTGVWRGPEMTGEIVGLDTVDLDGDGQLDLAIAFPNKILLGNMTGGNYQGMTFVDVPERLRVLGIEAADLDGNGMAELYVSAVKPSSVDSDAEKLASFVVDRVEGQLQIVADDIPYFFGSVEQPGEGKIIIVQLAENYERTYSGSVYRLERKGAEFDKGEEFENDYDKLTVHGFTPFESNGQKMTALFDINEKLEVIDANGDRLWTNGIVLGGSQTYIAHPDPVSTVGATPVNHFIKARICQLGDGTVLVPFNEGSKRLFSTREFNKSKIIAMQWDGYAMKEVWHTEPQGGYMADFRVADVDNDGKDEIVMGVLFSQGGLLKSVQKRSALVVYELP